MWSGTQTAVIFPYRWRRPLHWSTFSRCCCWSRSGTCLDGPAWRGGSERGQMMQIWKNQLKLKLKIPQWHNKWALSNAVQTHHKFPLGSLGHGDAVPVPLVSRDGPSHGAALQLQVLADVQLLRLWLDDQPQPTLRGVVAQPWRQWWSEEEISHICCLRTHSTLKNKSTLRKWSSQSWLCYTKFLRPPTFAVLEEKIGWFFFVGSFSHTCKQAQIVPFLSKTETRPGRLRCRWGSRARVGFGPMSTTFVPAARIILVWVLFFCL